MCNIFFFVQEVLDLPAFVVGASRGSSSIAIATSTDEKIGHVLVSVGQNRQQRANDSPVVVPNRNKNDGDRIHFQKLSSHKSIKDTAFPGFPTRPVRPMRWTYSSISLGMS